MGSYIVRNSQFKTGHTSLNEVSILLDDASEIATIGNDFAPGSFAYTADFGASWTLNSKLEWIPTESAGTSNAFVTTDDGEGNVVIAAYSSYHAVDDGEGNVEIKEGE